MSNEALWPGLRVTVPALTAVKVTSVPRVAKACGPLAPTHDSAGEPRMVQSRPDLLVNNTTTWTCPAPPSWEATAPTSWSALQVKAATVATDWEGVGVVPACWEALGVSSLTLGLDDGAVAAGELVVAPAAV